MMRNPTVLVIDDEFRADLYEMWLEKSCSVRTANSRTEALEKVDETVSVVLLRHEIAEDAKSDIETRVKAMSPACRIAVTTSKHVEVQFPDVDCDMTICEPVTERKISQVVDRLLRRALYHQGLRRHYRLAVQLTNVEFSGERNRNDEDFERLESRLQKCADYLDEVKRLLDPEDFRAVLDSLQLEKTMPKQSHGRKVKTDKHRPNSCRECKLPWGEYQGEHLGEGCETLGAFTWKCTRCHTVQSVPSPSDRTVAR